MAEQPSRFAALIEAIRSGSDSAARELYDTYGEHVRRIVRQKLDRRMRNVFDSTDFQQDVWASFFALPPERLEFREPGDLAQFLAKMVGHKVIDGTRARFGAKRDVMREKSLTTVGEENSAIVRAADTTPSQFAVADECWERLTSNRPPVIRQMLALLRDGHSYDEIARQTGLHPKAIQRFLQKLKKDEAP